jgi:hypothetical protein
MTPTFEGSMYIAQTQPGPGPSPPAKCPSACDSSASFCNTPDFEFSFAASSEGDWSSSPQGSEFSFQAYTNQLFVLNGEKMDAGPIGCAVNTTGSGGKLGHLEPDKSISHFKFVLIKYQPFRLEEGYFSCYPPVYDVVIDALGIAQGNTGLFLEVILMLVVLILIAAPASCALAKKSVSEEETDHINFTIAEIVKKIEHGKVGLRDFNADQVRVIDAMGVIIELAQERQRRRSSLSSLANTIIQIKAMGGLNDPSSPKKHDHSVNKHDDESSAPSSRSSSPTPTSNSIQGDTTTTNTMLSPAMKQVLVNGARHRSTPSPPPKPSSQSQSQSPPSSTTSPAPPRTSSPLVNEKETKTL